MPLKLITDFFQQKPTQALPILEGRHPAFASQEGRSLEGSWPMKFTPGESMVMWCSNDLALAQSNWCWNLCHLPVNCYKWKKRFLKNPRQDKGSSYKISDV